MLAVKLVRESFFGTEVMQQCTVMGHSAYPALPNAELNELKQILFSLFHGSGLIQLTLRVYGKTVLKPLVKYAKDLEHAKTCKVFTVS